MAVIGKGRRSKILLAKHVETGASVVLKRCMLSGASAYERELVREEINVHSQIDHPNVVSFYGSFEDFLGNVYVVLEHACLGDLYDTLQRRVVEKLFESREGAPTSRESILAMKVLRPIVLGLFHTHAMGFVHRDVKAENVFVTGEGRVKLGDFGFATRADAVLVDRVGTFVYMAPELLRCTPERRRRARMEKRSLYGKEIDCWAVGVLAHELLWGEVPYHASDENACEDLEKKILETASFEDVDDERKRSASPDAIDFVGRSLRSDPVKRLTAYDMLLHPWFSTRATWQNRTGTTASS